MPGFVDVTGWTSEEVRRMGHADDYDDVDHRPRQRYTSRPAGDKYTQSDVWAAACAAHRVNGGYFKEYAYNWSEVENRNVIAKRKNRDIMMEFLADPTQLTVDDVQQGEHCRNFLQNDLTLRLLKGKISEFDNAIKKVLAVQGNFDSFLHKYELAIVACLPQSVEKSEMRQEANSRIQFATGGHFGNVGDKVTVNIEVLSVVYSKQYDINWIRAVTDQDQPIFFGKKTPMAIGAKAAIQGKIKAHKDEFTQLSHVKEIK